MSSKIKSDTPPAFEIVEPKAASLTESLRSFGYDLSSAIADVIDNSISAEAKAVWVDFIWDGSNSKIVIVDNGVGMTEAQLRNAMRLGSSNPTAIRDENDLGRFGLGLKTASFSQCRSVTVRSKTEGGSAVVRRWDLDHLAKVNEWQVLLIPRRGSDRFLDRINDLESGTCVLWEGTDRIRGIASDDQEAARNHFFEQCEIVENHLALVFHRILQNSPRVQIKINGRSIQPADPFFKCPATQELQTTSLPDGSGGHILIEPFVMPHESKLPDENSKDAAGDPRDWAAKQGFYIYRKNRLLLAASWLNFRGWRKDDYHKLARIRINLSNSTDLDWQIDVTKRKASPPARLRERLYRIGEKTRERAKKVYTYRGARLVANSPRERKFVWNQIVRHGKASFEINRNHPMVTSFLENGDVQRREFLGLLKLIEDSIPTLLIASSNPETSPDNDLRPSTERNEEVQEMLLCSWHALRAKEISHSAAIKMLTAWEPFDVHPELIAELNINPPFV
jgi:hypothetical protein